MCRSVCPHMQLMVFEQVLARDVIGELKLAWLELRVGGGGDT